MTLVDQIAAAIDRVREGYRNGVVRAVVDRETQLRQLRRLLVEQELVLAEALHADLGKSSIEAYSTEIGFTLNELDHAVNHVRSWTQPHKVRVSMHLRPGSARVVQEPLGTVLVIAPWNYHTLLHVSVNELPFGGVGASGIGAYHGEAGFKIFSHAKPVPHRSTKPDSSLAYPPYTPFKQKLLRKLL